MQSEARNIKHTTCCTRACRRGINVHPQDGKIRDIKRIGKRGACAFIEIEWDEALPINTRRFGAARQSDPRRERGAKFASVNPVRTRYSAPGAAGVPDMAPALVGEATLRDGRGRCWRPAFCATSFQPHGVVDLAPHGDIVRATKQSLVGGTR